MAKSKMTIGPINQGDVKKEPPLEELPEAEIGELVNEVVPEDEVPVFPEKRDDVSGEIALEPEETDGAETDGAETDGAETDGAETVGALAVPRLVPIVGVRTLLAVFITVYYINSNILLLSTYTSVI